MKWRRSFFGTAPCRYLKQADRDPNDCNPQNQHSENLKNTQRFLFFYFHVSCFNWHLDGKVAEKVGCGDSDFDRALLFVDESTQRT
jgi:hypothetical protein